MGACRSRSAQRAARRREIEQEREELCVQAKRQMKTENRKKNRALERARLSSRDPPETFSDSATSANYVKFDRATTVHERNLAFSLHNQTLNRGIDYQRIVLEKLFDQPVLQPTLPDYVANHKRLAQCQTICHGLAEA